MLGESNRRAWLQRAGMGAGALALIDLLSRDEGRLSAAPPITQPSTPLAVKSPHFPATAKRVIWLFMHGGPSQVDTFDPKPTLKKFDGDAPPADYNELDLQFTQVSKQKLMASRMQFSRCGQSGVEICDEFRRLQACADDIAVVRSCRHEVFNHTPGIWLMNTGHARMGRPSLGSWLTYGLGCEADNLPAYVVLNDGPLKPGAGVWGNGFLPAVHQGTSVRTTGPPIPNLLPPSTSAAAQRETVDFVQWLNRRHRSGRESDTQLEARIASYELAFRMQAAAPEAVDLAQESKQTRDLYGAGFGESCLIARRLVERGVRMVQIYNGCPAKKEWDTHGNNHNRHLKLIEGVDQGCAALLTDLKARGLLDETLVIWGGEFGRTPTTEGGSGRDHSPYGFSTWLAGGGVKGGKTIGATDDLGFRAVERPVHVHDLHATILKLMGLDHERLTFFHESRDQRLTDVAGYHDIAAELTRG